MAVTLQRLRTAIQSEACLCRTGSFGAGHALCYEQAYQNQEQALCKSTRHSNRAPTTTS